MRWMIEKLDKLRKYNKYVNLGERVDEKSQASWKQRE